MFYKYLSDRIRTKIVSVFIILTFVSININASDSLSFINGLKATIKFNYGIVVPHHNTIRYLVNERITGFEVCLATQSYGRTVYDKLYRYPRLGIGIMSTSLGNNEIFGRGNSLFGFIDVPFSKYNKKLNVNYQFEFGVGYISKHFDTETNIMNVAISCPLNAFIGFAINGRYRINDKNEVQAGIKMFHFSNGKIYTPNLGLNSVVLSAGYIFVLKPYKYERRTIENPINNKKSSMSIIYNAGAKADDQLTDKKYFISSLVADYEYCPYFKYGYGLGFDFFYDASLGPNMVSDLGGNYTNADLFQAGIHGGFYPHYSKITFIIQCGTYVYSTYNKYADVYSRLGFRYKINNNLLINLTLKSHKAIADFVEWGFGFSF